MYLLLLRSVTNRAFFIFFEVVGGIFKQEYCRNPKCSSKMLEEVFTFIFATSYQVSGAKYVFHCSLFPEY